MCAHCIIFVHPTLVYIFFVCSYKCWQIWMVRKLPTFIHSGGQYPHLCEVYIELGGQYFLSWYTDWHSSRQSPKWLHCSGWFQPPMHYFDGIYKSSLDVNLAFIIFAELSWMQKKKKKMFFLYCKPLSFCGIKFILKIIVTCSLWHFNFFF